MAGSDTPGLAAVTLSWIAHARWVRRKVVRSIGFLRVGKSHDRARRDHGAVCRRVRGDDQTRGAAHEYERAIDRTDHTRLHRAAKAYRAADAGSPARPTAHRQRDS